MADRRLSHAYMLAGPEGPARMERARHLAAALLCPQPDAPCLVCRDCRKVLEGIHPDVTVLTREKSGSELSQEIKVGQIRQMTADAAIAPNEAERKVYIIDGAERMNGRAQNALLKTLEDPPGHACFILCCTAPDGLLPTVRSRCVRAPEPESRTESPAAVSELAQAYLQAAASGDRAQIALCCMSRAGLSREETEAFADQVRAAVDGVLHGALEDPGLETRQLLYLASLMDKTEDYLRHNVSPKQIFGMLAAETFEVTKICRTL